MPNYGFICNGCKHAFDRLLQIILKDYGSYTQVLTSDTKLTPDKATGGKWSELMNRMKRGVGKQHHQNLDSATARTGRQWLG